MERELNYPFEVENEFKEIRPTFIGVEKLKDPRSIKILTALADSCYDEDGADCSVCQEAVNNLLELEKENAELREQLRQLRENTP